MSSHDSMIWLGDLQHFDNSGILRCMLSRALAGAQFPSRDAENSADIEEWRTALRGRPVRTGRGKPPDRDRLRLHRSLEQLLALTTTAPEN
jgi:hypothetical protein